MSNEFMTVEEYEELRCKLCNFLFGKCEICPLSKFDEGCCPSSEYDIICDGRINIVKNFGENA